MVALAHYSEFVLANQNPKSLRTSPDMSANALILGRWGGDGNSPTSADERSGFLLQEAELRYTSNIDAYFSGDVTLAVHPEDGEYHVEPEEISVQTLAIPQVTFTIGKFQPHFNRHNVLHTHAFPFIDRPLPNEIIFGEEGGINESGVSASYLIPSDTYQEVVFHVFSGDNEAIFNSPSKDDVAGSLFYKNLRDLSKESTLEFDLSHIQGSNYANGITRLYGMALTYKWRPLAQNAYRSFSWTMEYTRSEKTGDPAALTPDQTLEPHEGGVSSWVQYQWDKRYWIQARAEYFGLPKPVAGVTEKYSGLIAFVPTEYSALRLQFDNILRPDQDSEQRVMAQLNVSIGAHPAHDY